MERVSLLNRSNKERENHLNSFLLQKDGGAVSNLVSNEGESSSQTQPGGWGWGVSARSAGTGDRPNGM